MNGNQLDDLFKQKLGNQKLAPPASSWDQIQNNLKENKSKGVSLWIKIAASFILLLTAGWLILSVENTSPQNTIAKIVEEAEADIATPNQNDPKSNKPSVIAPIEEDPIIKLKPADNNPTILLAQSVEQKEGVLSEPNPFSERVLLKEIALLELELSAPSLLIARSNHSQILPMDVRMMRTYAIEKNEEVKKSRKFRMLNGIISIAKGVNKSKLGFEDIRNAKNGFVNDELKYGTKETEDVVEENNTKSGDLNK